MNNIFVVLRKANVLLHSISFSELKIYSEKNKSSIHTSFISYLTHKFLAMKEKITRQDFFKKTAIYATGLGVAGAGTGFLFSKEARAEGLVALREKVVVMLLLKVL